MNRDDIIRMAREAGLSCNELHCSPPIITWRGDESELERFAKLVAAAEREVCAKVCDEWANGWSSEPEMEKMAAEIRARGQQ